MYTEERNEFPIKDLLVKILILALFVFALLWFFPIGRNKETLKNYDNRTFIDNIASMKDAAKNYYTSKRVPKKVSEKASMTLQEMLDKKLLIGFTDGNNKECNTKNSYVEITHLGDEYALKVYLSCENQSDYIIELIDPNKLAPEKVVEQPPKEEEKPSKPEKPSTPSTPTKKTKTVTEYEYVKQVSSWSPYSAWTTEFKATNGNLQRKEKTQYIGVKIGSWSNWIASDSYVGDKYDVNNYYKVREATAEEDCYYTGWRYEGVLPPSLYPKYDTDTTAYTFVDYYNDGINLYYIYEKHTRSEKCSTTYKYKTREVTYTDWVDAIPAGYEKFKTKTVYSYSTKTIKTETTWSTKTSLQGWTKTGKTRTKTVVI